MEENVRNRVPRQEIVDALEARSSVAAQLYERCVHMLASYSPDSATARLDLLLVCHCVREFINSLPELLGEDVSKASTGNVQASLDALKDSLKACEDNDLVSVSGNSYSILPSDVVGALQQYRDALKRGHYNSAERDSLTVLGDVEVHNPAVQSWISARHFFMQYVHMERSDNQVMRLPTSSEALSNFSVIENALSARFAFYFDVKSRIIDTLKSANCKEPDGSYVAPTPSQVLETLSSLSDHFLRNVFYQELENPLWLEPLRKASAFDDLPDADSASASCGWPEGFYLKRIAASRPKEVSNILVELQENKSLYYRRTCIEVLALLQPEDSVDIARIVNSWASEGFGLNTFLWDTDALPRAVNKLTDGNHKSYRAGSNLLRQCFMPLRSDGYKRVTALVHGYHYQQYLLEACEHLTTNAYYMLLKELLQCALSLLQPSKDSSLSSNFFIPSIEDERCGDDDDILAILTRDFLDVVVEAFSSGETRPLENALDNTISSYACRITIYGLHLSVLSSAVQNADGLSKGIGDLVRSKMFYDSEFDAELYPLVSAALDAHLISAEDVAAAIAAGLDAERNEYERLATIREMDIDAGRMARRWQHRALLTIGAERLTPSANELLEDLEQEFGDCVYPLKTFEVTTITGPNSPLTMDEARCMSADELLCYMRSFEPSDSDKQKLISHEGLGRLIARRVFEIPGLFDGKASAILELRPTYQRAIVEGWSEALDSGKRITLSDFLTIANHCAPIADDVKFPTDCDAFDDDHDYRALKKTCARLISSYLRKIRDCATDERDEILYVIEQILHSSNPAAGQEMLQSGSLKALDAAINVTHSIAVAALVEWLSAFPDCSRSNRALDVLEGYLPDQWEYVSDAAAMGEALPRLWKAFPEWVGSHYRALFGSEDGVNAAQQIVLTTILSCSNPGVWLYSKIEPALRLAVKRGAERYELSFGNRGCELMIGDWLYSGIANGAIDKNSVLLREWRAGTSLDIQCNVLDRLCRMLRGSNEVPDSIVERVGDLWDYHAELCASNGELLQGILALATSGKFSFSWWGPRLMREAASQSEEHDVILVKDQLVDGSHNDPNLAVRVLDALVENDPHPYAYFYSEVAREVLTNYKDACVASGEEFPDDDARRCMDHLGRIGCTDLDSIFSD